MAKQTVRTSSFSRALAAVVVGAPLALVPYTALAQGGTSPQTPGMGGAQSGSAIDSPKGADVSRPRSSPEDQRQFDAPFTGQALDWEKRAAGNRKASWNAQALEQQTHPGSGDQSETSSY